MCSKLWLCNCSLAGVAGLNPAKDMDACLLFRVFECYVLSGRGLCNWLITCPEESDKCLKDVLAACDITVCFPC